MLIKRKAQNHTDPKLLNDNVSILWNNWSIIISFLPYSFSMHLWTETACIEVPGWSTLPGDSPPTALPHQWVWPRWRCHNTWSTPSSAVKTHNCLYKTKPTSFVHAIEVLAGNTYAFNMLLIGEVKVVHFLFEGVQYLSMPGHIRRQDKRNDRLQHTPKHTFRIV